MRTLICCHYLSPTIATYLTAIGTLLTGFATVSIVFWAMKKFRINRKSESVLNCKITKKKFEINNSKKIHLDIEFKNDGLVEIRTRKRVKEYVWEDKMEKVKYSIELQIKKVLENSLVFNWFDEKQ